MVLVETPLFLFFPNNRPNTVLSDDFFRCGVAMFNLGGLFIDICGGLACLEDLSSGDCVGIGVDWESSDGVPTGIPVTSVIFSSSVPVDVRNRERISSPSAPIGIAIPAPGFLIGKSSFSIGIGFEICFPRMEPTVSARLSASAFHFPEALNLLIVC